MKNTFSYFHIDDLASALERRRCPVCRQRFAGLRVRVLHSFVPDLCTYICLGCAARGALVPGAGTVIDFGKI